MIAKKIEVQAQDPTITKWVIFFRKDPRQRVQSNTTLKRYAKYFTDAGFDFCNGDDEINAYIESIIANEDMASQPIINIANVTHIPLSLIIDNENNREIKQTAVDMLVSAIIANGFVTQINVVPESIDGKLTGRMVAFEGHTRLAALRKLVGMDMLEDPSIPCVVTHWLTSEDKQEVANLLCKTNTTATPWELKNYINFHFSTSLPNYVNDPEKNFSYGVLKYLRTAGARTSLVIKHGEKMLFGENYLIYIFGPKKNSLTDAKFLDTSAINNGLFRCTNVEFTLMKKFMRNVLLPFHEWFYYQDHFDSQVLRRFMKGVWEEYKADGGKSVEKIDQMINYFKTLQTPPVKESDLDRAFWEDLNLYINSGSSKTTNFNVSTSNNLVTV